MSPDEGDALPLLPGLTNGCLPLVPRQRASPEDADEDSLDKEQIDQLHAVTLQVSSNCFELKKLCATGLSGSRNADSYTH